MFRIRLLASSAAGVLTLLMAGAAAAQAATDPVSTLDGGQPTALDEVIVTGEKANRSLQDTSASVAVTTARRIEQEAVQSLAEVFQRTANMSETYGHQGFTIRGVNNQGVSGGGDAALTTIYVDGAPLPPSIAYSGPTDAWDMRQVEIFRGPQSTLQGLNALGGAVVMRSNDPTFTWDARVRAIIADPEDRAFAFAGGGPLVADQLAFRLSAEKRDSDGFIHNTTRDAAEDPVDTLTVRAKLLWTPTGLPGLEAGLGYTRFESDGGYLFSYTDTTVANYYDDRRAASNTPNLGRVDADLATLELTYPLSDRLDLSAVTSWSSVENFLQYDGDGRAANTSYGNNNTTYDTLTQELRLNYRGDRWHGLLGAFYYKREQQQNTASRTNVTTPVNTISALLQGSGVPASTADALASLYATALPVIPVDFTSDYPSEVETYAIFADGAYDLTDRLSLIGGFRWDHEENRITVAQSAVFVGTYPDPLAFGAAGTPLYSAVIGINAGVAGLVSQASSTTPPADRSFDAFLPKLGVRYKWTDDLSTAFVVQRGYRSGGSSGNTARSQVFAYDPEYTWNYEASLRSVWLDGSLMLNANAYYVDWTDQQVSVNFGLNAYDYHTVNAGQSHLYGAELEASHRISGAFDWYGSIGYSRTKFDEFVTSVSAESNDLSGTEFSYAPRWTTALGGNYRWGSGFIANLNANYRSKVFSQTGSNQASSVVGSRVLVNAKLGYETGRWGVYLYGKNILDEDYMTYARTSTGEAILGDPRVVGVILQARW
ncbi:MAG: TonB-dependent receptor [Brevundimonas sp.]